MNKIFFLILPCLLWVIFSCNNESSNNLIESSSMKEEIIEIDSLGQVRKTYDGELYRIYNENGLLIELYGHVQDPLSDYIIRTIIDIDPENKIYTTKTYLNESLNQETYQVKKPFNYYKKIYYYSGEGFKDRYLEYWELYHPVFDENGNYVNHKLTEIKENPVMNPFYKKAPSK